MWYATLVICIVFTSVTHQHEAIGKVMSLSIRKVVLKLMLNLVITAGSTGAPLHKKKKIGALHMERTQLLERKSDGEKGTKCANEGGG